MREKFLTSLDVGPSGAILRVVAGLLFTVALRRTWPAAGPGFAAAALLVLLFGVKVATAVLRRFAGATPRVQAVWGWRRNIARWRDSYQWRKLVWFGAGILAAGLLGPRGGWELPLGVACLGSGAAAELFWRRKQLPLEPPVRA